MIKSKSPVVRSDKLERNHSGGFHRILPPLCFGVASIDRKEWSANIPHFDKNQTLIFYFENIVMKNFDMKCKGREEILKL